MDGGSDRRELSAAPGAMYEVRVIALAVFLLGLSIGSPAFRTDAAERSRAVVVSPRHAALLIPLSLATGLAVVCWSRRGRRPPHLVTLEQVTSLCPFPVIDGVGRDSPAAQPPRRGTRAVRRTIVRASEAYLLLSLLLVSWQAVQHRQFAARLVASPLDAYAEAIASTLLRWR